VPRQHHTRDSTSVRKRPKAARAGCQPRPRPRPRLQSLAHVGATVGTVGRPRGRCCLRFAERRGGDCATAPVANEAAANMASKALYVGHQLRQSVNQRLPSTLRQRAPPRDGSADSHRALARAKLAGPTTPRLFRARAPHELRDYGAWPPTD